MQEEERGIRRRDSVAIIQIEQDELDDFISESTVTYLIEQTQNERPDATTSQVSMHRAGGNYNYETRQFNLVEDVSGDNPKEQEVSKPADSSKSPVNMSKKREPKVQEVLVQKPAAKVLTQESPNKIKPEESDRDVAKPKNAGHMRLMEQIKRNGLRLDSLDGQVFVSLSEAELCGESRIEKGRILLTSYRIAFFVAQRKKIDIPLGFIERVVFKQDKKNFVMLELILKYSPIWRFNFANAQAGIMVDNMLNLYIFPTSLTDYFAFSYAKNKQSRSDYRFKYNFFTEYGRLGFLNNAKFKAVENINSRYCDTYPSMIIVPYQASEHLIKNVAKCRDRERFPVATYLHKNPDTGITSCLWRSSQIRASSDKWLSDIEYLLFLSYDTRLILIDARTKQNAKNMQASELYKQLDVEFANLEPVQNIKSSYLKMIEACLIVNNPKFIKNVVESKWYDQIRMLLKTSERIACLLASSRNVLVKCSDGWDRTSQLCALALIIIDPYYRTIQGFEVLVQKEFCAFGEPFHLRLGLKGRGQEQIPVFVQFLDCVTQIMAQYPLSFQFSYKYLSLLAHALYTNKYGNFLVSCEREFIEYGIKQRTVSVWEQLAQNPLSLNPFYSNQTQTGIQILSVMSSIKANRFWRQHFYYLTTSLKDTYKTHPYAEENQDYIYLRHMKMKTQSEMLRKNVSEQMRKMKELSQQLADLVATPQKPRELEVVYDD